MKIALLCAALVAMLFAVPAQAGEVLGTPHAVTFNAPVACSVVCAYWQGPAAAGFNECTNPFPEGSYDQLTVTAPLGANLLKFEIFPVVDYDSFICRANNGVTLATGANQGVDNCDNLFGPNNPVSIGCYEKSVTPVVPGTRYLLRVYNWSDATPTQAQYTFLRI